jgi:hypothetical protein
MKRDSLKYLFILLFFCGVQSVFAQRRQGMEDVIKDSIQLKKYKSLAGKYYTENNIAQLATTLKKIADYYYKQNDKDSLFVYYNLAKNNYVLVQDSFYVAYCLHRIGGETIHSSKADSSGLILALSALQYFEKTGEYLLAAHTSYDISLYYLFHNKTGLRNHFWNKAAEMNRLANDTLLDIIMLLSEATKLKDSGKINLSVVKLNEALQKSRMINKELFIKESLFKLGSSYLLLNNPRKAAGYLEESAKLVTVHFDKDLPELYRLLSVCYIRVNEKNKAEEYLALYRSSLDSVIRKREVQNYEGLLVKYEAEKKQATIAALEQENKLKKSQAANQRVLIFSLAGLLALLLITGWIVANNRQRRKNMETEMQSQKKKYEEALQKEKEEKMISEFEKQLAEVQLTALNAQMNPHFIFNCMNSIQKYILKNEKSKALDFLQHFSELMRLVLDNSSKNKIGLDEELNMLEKYIQLEQQRLDFSFDYTLDVAEGLQTDFYEIPAMIIQPYVENAIWHGLMNKEGKGLLSVRFESTDNLIKCTVEDNGVGRRKAAEMEQEQSPRRKSYGMSISKKRIGLLKKENLVVPDVKITDLTDADNKPAGTSVVIYIPFD